MPVCRRVASPRPAAQRLPRRGCLHGPSRRDAHVLAGDTPTWAGRLRRFDALPIVPAAILAIPERRAEGRIMTEPLIAAKAPSKVALEAGKDYWWCACGRSQNQPFCDGSHKGTGLAPSKVNVATTADYWLCACKHS